MDAFELTRPVLSARPLRVRRESPRVQAETHLAEARKYAYQLPLGTAPLPLAGRDRWTTDEAFRTIERSLWRVAAATGAVITIGQPGAALASRLARTRAISPPAADAIAALLPALEAGEPGSAKVAERVVGYLESRV